MTDWKFVGAAGCYTLVSGLLIGSMAWIASGVGGWWSLAGLVVVGAIGKTVTGRMLKDG